MEELKATTNKFSKYIQSLGQYVNKIFLIQYGFQTFVLSLNFLDEVTVSHENRTEKCKPSNAIRVRSVSAPAEVQGSVQCRAMTAWNRELPEMADTLLP